MLTFQTDFQSERIAIVEDQRVAVNDTYIRHLLIVAVQYLYLVRNT